MPVTQHGDDVVPLFIKPESTLPRIREGKIASSLYQLQSHISKIADGKLKHSCGCKCAKRSVTCTWGRRLQLPIHHSACSFSESMRKIYVFPRGNRDT